MYEIPFVRPSTGMDQTYKSQKEAFVSNLSGGSIMEINLVSFIAPASLLLWYTLQSRLSFFDPYTVTSLATDFLLNIAAILFAMTAYSSAPLLLNILLVSPAVLLILTGPKTTRGSRKAKPARLHDKDESPGKLQNKRRNINPPPTHPFITSYRGTMLVTTCIAILAVDFQVFPRRFAKAENWGTSLMDLGVGSFVFSAGVVSARSILQNEILSSPQRALTHRLIVSFRHSIPLLLLGFIRLLSVKGLDYAEHVTEYGVHWNFFFTLGLMPPFVEVFHSLTAVVPSYEVLTLFVAISYQIGLESTGLKAYILISPRGLDLLSQNREGIFSFIGYLAIFLAGRATGLRIVSCESSLIINPRRARSKVLVNLLALTSFWTILFILNSTHASGYGAGIPVSRRLANMPYVLWVAAFNTAHILLFCLLETIFSPPPHRAPNMGNEVNRNSPATSRILTAFNKNGLFIFLIANLLTGAVNLSLNTINASYWQAMTILTGYGVILAGVALGLDFFKLKVKL